MIDLEKIRPIYSELQGMLSQAPDNLNVLHESEESLWVRFNELVNKLASVTDDETYNEFKLKPEINDGYISLSVTTYRGRLSGLVSRLHGTYFTKENAPFSGSPQTVISQQANQSVNLQMYIQLGISLENARSKAETTEEKNFINNVMAGIETVKSFMEFLLLVLNTAAQFGIPTERLRELFS